jgi:hypothetical protein
MGHSFAQLRSCGFPEVKVEVDSIGNGLTLAYTWHHDGGCAESELVWVVETRCHPFCSFVSDSCVGNLSVSAWLQLIEKKHLEALEKLPRV